MAISSAIFQSKLAHELNARITGPGAEEVSVYNLPSRILSDALSSSLRDYNTKQIS